MRVLFASSSGIGLPALEALAARHEVVGILTAPPSRKGRGLAADEGVVADAARVLLPRATVLAPPRLGAEARAEAAALGAEILVTFSYGRIFGPRFLALFPAGGLNVHPSLLPRWRGCAPVQAAILARDDVTGVSVQRIELEVDTGDVFARREIRLSGRETASGLSSVAARLGAEALLEALDAVAGGRPGEKQDHARATWSRQFGKDDGLLDWNSPTLDLDARVRAFDPWPGTFTFLDGQTLGILEAEPYPGEGAGLAPGLVTAIDKSRGVMIRTSDGLLAAIRLRLQARKPLHFRDFANGMRDLAGRTLGSPPMERA